MQCARCSHRIPDMAEKCLYCGAETGAAADASLPSQDAGKARKPSDEVKRRKLDDLPAPLRAQVEQMLKTGAAGMPQKSPPSPGFTFPPQREKKKMGFISALKYLLKHE